jgi:serine protease Do
VTGSRNRGTRVTARTARQVAIVGIVLAAVALLVVAALFLQGRRDRIRMEREIVQLKTELTDDRHARVGRLAAIAAERKRLAEREASVAAQLEGLHESERTLRLELAEARTRAATGGTEVADLKARLGATQRSLREFELDQSRAEQMIGALQGGVAFVEGTYGFHDAAGAPIRFAGLDAKGNPETDAEGKPLLSGSGPGTVVRLRYTGTAFLVSRDGTLFTNRHIAEPWWRNDEVKPLVAKGYSPRLVSLRAYFSSIPTAFDLRVVSLSDEADAAVVAVVSAVPAVPTAAVSDLASLLSRLPVLPIDTGQPPSASGQPIVLLGYPTGHDALLARLDQAVVRKVLDVSGGDTERITAELARLGQIRPLATQGHLSDVLPGHLAYDAQTTFGGSGGPILSARGRVIGVNAAILTEFSGASFGVPIRFASALLPAVPKVPVPKAPGPRPKKG